MRLNKVLLLKTLIPFFKKLEKTEDGWKLTAVDAEKMNADSAPKPLYWVCYNKSLLKINRIIITYLLNRLHQRKTINSKRNNP